MNKFFSEHRLCITPISPIHIGTGEVYEPTHVVVDPKRGFLYGFNPASVFLLDDERQALKSATSNGLIRDINLFYDKNIDVFRPWATSIVPMTEAAVGTYRKMIAPKGNQKNTQIEVFRTISSRMTTKSAPMIPGSTVKGMIRTALMNRLNAGHRIRSDNLDLDLLDGNFDRSPMRFVKVSDLQPVNEDVSTKVYYCSRVFKSNGALDGVKSCFESVQAGQYRAFCGSVVIAAGQNRTVSHVYQNPEEIIRDLNAYSESVWQAEQGLYGRMNAAWATSVSRLLKALKPQFDSGKIALIRLGKNGGAEMKTLHGEGVAKIQIRHKDKTRDVLDHSTTLWMTEEKEAIDNALPFGWAICEIDPEGENQALHHWCDQSGYQSEAQRIATEWATVLEAREEKLALKQQEKAKEAQLEAERKAQALAEEQKQQALAAMSPQERATVELYEKLEAFPGAVNPGTELFIQIKNFLVEALTWKSAEDKKALAEKMQPLMKKKGMYQGKAEKEFKKNMRELRGEA